MSTVAGFLLKSRGNGLSVCSESEKRSWPGVG